MNGICSRCTFRLLLETAALLPAQFAPTTETSALPELSTSTAAEPCQDGSQIASTLHRQSLAHHPRNRSTPASRNACSCCAPCGDPSETDTVISKNQNGSDGSRSRQGLGLIRFRLLIRQRFRDELLHLVALLPLLALVEGSQANQKQRVDSLFELPKLALHKQGLFPAASCGRGHIHNGVSRGSIGF